jgi:predicted ABC-type exoprotein transport system permease subunit
LEFVEVIHGVLGEFDSLPQDSGFGEWEFLDGEIIVVIFIILGLGSSWVVNWTIEVGSSELLPFGIVDTEFPASGSITTFLSSTDNHHMLTLIQSLFK